MVSTLRAATAGGGEWWPFSHSSQYTWCFCVKKVVPPLEMKLPVSRATGTNQLGGGEEKFFFLPSLPGFTNTDVPSGDELLTASKA